MAGRKISLRARAAACVALVIAGFAAPSIAATSGPIVVAQEDGFGTIPFGLRSDTGRVQKLAQTFVAPKEAHKLALVSVPFRGAKGSAVVKVFEVGEKPPFGTLLGEATVAVEDGEHPVQLRPALAVDPGQRYSIVLEAARRRHSFTAGFVSAGSYRGGQLWCYCPRWKDGGPTDKRWWQSAKELDHPKEDLTFELRFWRKG